MVNNGDLDRITRLARLYASAEDALTDDMIMPVIGWLFGGFDFSSYFIKLGPIPATSADWNAGICPRPKTARS